MSNAQKVIYKRQNQEDLFNNPPDFFIDWFCSELKPVTYIFFVRVPGDFIDSLKRLK